MFLDAVATVTGYAKPPPICVQNIEQKYMPAEMPASAGAWNKKKDKNKYDRENTGYIM